MLALPALSLCLLLGADPAAPAAPPAPAAEPRLVDGATAWRAARWGMTVDEVVAALGGEAKKVDPPLALADGRVIAAEVPAFPIAGLTYRAHFLFQDGKLSRVSLKNLPTKKAEGGDFDALRDRLAKETGAPGEERPKATSVDFREVRFTSGGTAVDLKFLEGALVLLYHPAAPVIPPALARPPSP